MNPSIQPRSYSIHWTPSYIAWTLDEVVFRNVNKVGRAAYEMRSPWRPATYRLIFHTGNGSLHPLPAAHVYIKRIAYEPLPPTPLLSTRSGVQFVISAAAWSSAYAIGMLLLGCGVRAAASNRHYQILDDDALTWLPAFLRGGADDVAPGSAARVGWGGGGGAGGGGRVEAAAQKAPLLGVPRPPAAAKQPAVPTRRQGEVHFGL